MPETDKEFLLRMAGLVDSENWGTSGQVADQTRIKSIANRLEDTKYSIDHNTPINNPHGHPIKYGRDHGEAMTMGDLVDKLIEAAGEEGVTNDELCDFLDRQFLFGSWRNELEMRDPTMIRDLRGVIVLLMRKAA